MDKLSVEEGSFANARRGDSFGPARTPLVQTVPSDTFIADGQGGALALFGTVPRCSRLSSSASTVYGGSAILERYIT